jgi:phospholipid N-methyltransferase
VKGSGVITKIILMQEHRQRQMSVRKAPTHFGHMINCLKILKMDAPNVNVIVKERRTYRL